MSEVDLATLPDLVLVDEDYAAQLTRLKADYQAATGVYPRPSYPETFLLEQLAYESALLRQLINAEGRQNLLAYGAGDRLEHLGALLDVARLAATPAQTTLRFAIADGAPQITIPAGTEVQAADGETRFATTTYASVPPGNATWDVVAACTVTGTAGNGFEAGEIAQLIPTIPYVTGAENLSVTTGGAGEESDDRFRTRIHLAPAKFSVAGSEQSYVYWVLSAHPSIVDVRVWGLAEAPGEVHVCALLTGGQVPDATMRDLILETIGASRVRPLTDFVIWEDPQATNYTIEVELQVFAEHAALAASAQASAESRLSDLADQWAERLGRDIVPEAIVERCQSLAGVYRTVVTTPIYATLDRNEFPVCTGITVSTTVVEESA